MAFELTAEGGAQFAAACARIPVGRFVLLGSSSEYGPRDEPLHEDLADRPVSIHGRAKSALTTCVRKLSTADLNAVILRIFHAYGHGDDSRRFIPTICRAAEEGRGVRITPRGFVRDYIHVDDVVRACLHAGALSIDRGEIINVGTGIATDNHDVVDIVQSLCDGRPQVLSKDFPPRDVDFGGWRAETTKMNRLLRLGDLVSVQQGIRQILQHVRVAS
jgi:UDP-glucose 4-epimerase